MAKRKTIRQYVDEEILGIDPGGAVINDITESAVTTYSSEKVESLVASNAMRGVAVFVSATQPTGMQVNDIWIQI